jgi:hypothetical protein
MSQFQIFQNMMDVAGFGVLLPGGKTQQEHAFLILVKLEFFPKVFPAKFGVQIGK